MRRLDASEEFGKGLTVRQQMFYAAVSLELHRRDPEGLDTTALVAELMERYTPFRHVPGTFFHESFGHLDGYSALYYTYMWSLVIAKDLFSRLPGGGDPRAGPGAEVPQGGPRAGRVEAGRRSWGFPGAGRELRPLRALASAGA